MRVNRDASIELCFGSEKGYVNRPETDNGGPTNMGITLKTLSAWRRRPVTIAELQQMTKKEAWDIYASEYWNPIAGDDLPSGLDYAVFDSCVTSGPNRAARILQEALVKAGTAVGIDGNIGAETLAAVEKHIARYGLADLIKKYCAERIIYMKSLKGKKGWPSNGRGWHIRVTGIDPQGKWATQPGVVGNAIKMSLMNLAVKAAQVEPMPPHDLIHTEIPDGGNAKARDSATGLRDIAVKPEAVATYVATGTGVLTAVSGNNVLSYALGIILVIAACCAGYYFVHRIRNSNA